VKILALDFATKTGWAHSTGPSGVWDLSIRKDESSGMRLVRFESKLREVYTGLGVDVLVFEAVTVGGGLRVNFDSIKLQSKLQAIIERFVARTPGLECCSYNLNEIKKYAIPQKGKRDKEAMLEAAKRRWPGREFVDDNEVDACWLLDLAKTQLE